MAMTLKRIANSLRGIAQVIREHGTCGAGALEVLANDIDAHSSAQAKVRADDTREQFEVWMVETGEAYFGQPDFRIGEAGEYEDMETYCAWFAWKGAIESFAARLSQGAQGEAVAKLDKPALVGHTQFGVGIAWSTVIGAAQRAYEWKDDKMSPEQIAAFYIAFPHLAPSHEKVKQSAERAAVPDRLVDAQKVKRLKAVADGLRRIQEFESARYLDEYAAILTAAPQPPEGARVVDAISESPLAGEWRFNNGYLCCGTFRVMVQDWEAGVCAAGDMRQQVGKWIAETLNRNGGGMDAWAIADKVRRALDKQSCPDHWMRVAFESTVSSIQSVDAPTLAGKEG